MDLQGLKDLLSKIPFAPFILAVVGWYAWDWRNFETDPGSPKNQKMAQVLQLEQQKTKLEEEVKKIEEFRKSLEIKKEELRSLAKRLTEMKEVLTEEIDTPGLIRLINTEAKKVGLRVMSLRPQGQTKKEFYVEQPFELAFRGVYAQVVIFLQRLGNAQRVLRVDDFQVRQMDNSGSRFTQLEGRMKLKAYRYEGSKADEIAKKQASGGSS